MFDSPKPTSNLRQPDFERFMGYADLAIDAKRYSNRGPAVLLLEQRLAAFHEVSHCITFCSGFYALTACLKLFLTGQRRVLLPSLTYRRMPDILSWVGAKPLYVDVCDKAFCLTADLVSQQSQTSYDLILAPHPIVNCLDVEALEAVAKSCGKPIVFDSVESVYETVNSKRIGGFGEAEVFSLHACKLINGFGGGYVTTNNEACAERLKTITKFGFEDEDIVVEPFAGNFKLNEFHAAMALASLDEVDEQLLHNKAIYQAYRACLENVRNVEILPFDETEKSGFKNIVVKFDKNWPVDIDTTVNLLIAENILARRYYYPPLHKATAYNPNEFLATENGASRLVNMPCGSFVCVEDVKKICSRLALMISHKA